MTYIIHMWIDFGTDFVIENTPRNLTKLTYIHIHTAMYKRFKLFSEYSRGLSLGVGLCK